MESELIYHCSDEKNIHLITELCTGGELFDLIVEREFLPEQEAAKIFR